MKCILFDANIMHIFIVTAIEVFVCIIIIQDMSWKKSENQMFKPYLLSNVVI